MPEPLRWGIIGLGKISEDFVTAIRNTKHPNEIVAVAASSFERAATFKQKHSLSEETSVYGNYDDILKDSEVEVVYVGLMNHLHYEVVLKALDAGKHIVCEKPFAPNYKQAKTMIDKAREKRLFLMEGAWSRFFPAWEMLRKELREKKLGSAKSVFANFGVGNLPPNRLMLDLSASPLNDIGCYCLSLAYWVFEGETPDKVQVIGRTKNGVDMWATIILEFSNDRKAILTYSGEDHSGISAIVTCENGRYEFPEAFNCPTQINRVTINTNIPGATSGAENFKFPINDDGTYNFRNSAGLRYEIDGVFEAIRAGKTESGIVPHADTLKIASAMDEAKRQLGVVYKQDL